MAFATRDLLIGGAEIRAGEEIPEVVRFAGTDRPVDVPALVERGDAAKTRRGLKATDVVK